MILPVSNGVPPNKPVPFTIFRKDPEEPVLLIPTQLLESLYTEDSSGEKRKQ